LNSSALISTVNTLGVLVWQGPDSVVARAEMELLNLMMDQSVSEEVRTRATEVVIALALRDPSQTDVVLSCLPTVRCVVPLIVFTALAQFNTHNIDST
jgi:hypothetical protein